MIAEESEFRLREVDSEKNRDPVYHFCNRLNFSATAFSVTAKSGNPFSNQSKRGHWCERSKLPCIRCSSSNSLRPCRHVRTNCGYGRACRASTRGRLHAF